MKKIIKWIAIVIGIFLALVVAASAAIIIIVDKTMVEDQMKSALNRHVSIKDINVGIFSVVSGIEVKDVRISNFKTKTQLKKLQGKVVSKRDLFVGLESFNFKVKFLPLLQKKFVLQSLVLNKPQIHIIRSSRGHLNIDDLLKPGKKEPEKKPKKVVKKEIKKIEKEEDFTADSLPIAINIGEVGIKKGVVSITDNQFKQKFLIYNLTTLVHSIKIDPKDLKKKNQIKVKFDMAIKTVGPVKTGSVKTFDISFYARGSVTPFDLKSRKLDPAASLKIGSNRGTVTGLQILKTMKNIPVLKKYCGKLSFLSDTQSWKNASMSAWYKSGTLKVQDGKIKTGDFATSFGGWMNFKSKAISFAVDLILAKKHKKYLHSGIASNAKKLIKGKIAKFVKPKQIADIALKPLLNKNGEVFLKYKVTGTTSKPRPRLVHPQLGSLSQIVQKQAGSAFGSVTNQVKKKATNAVKSRAKTEADKRLKGLKKRLPF